jgi:hypothetical protein
VFGLVVDHVCIAGVKPRIGSAAAPRPMARSLTGAGLFVTEAVQVGLGSRNSCV